MTVRANVALGIIVFNNVVSLFLLCVKRCLFMERIKNIIIKLENLYSDVDSLNFEIENLYCEDSARDTVSDSNMFLNCCLENIMETIDSLNQIEHICPNCGYYLTANDSLYCENCSSNNSEICGYHDYNITDETISTLTFGVELETSEINYPVTTPYGWVCAEDSSISGLEYVSRVYDFSETNIFRNDIISLCEKLSSVGADTHKDTETGLHIHISQSGFGCTNKELWNFILRYKYEFMSVGGRLPYRESFGYCEPKNNLCSDGRSVFDRYGLLNLNQKYKTVEFRFFNGTLNPETIRLRVQFLQQLTYFSPEINSETTFSDFLDYLWLYSTEVYDFVQYWLGKRETKVRDLFK